jgi:uncharacterized protein YjaZ
MRNKEQMETGNGRKGNFGQRGGVGFNGDIWVWLDPDRTNQDKSVELADSESWS